MYSRRVNLSAIQGFNLKSTRPVIEINYNEKHTPKNTVTDVARILLTQVLYINRSSRRKRYQTFPNELCYGYLRFEGNGKIPLGSLPSWLNWDSQLDTLFSLPFLWKFLISFKPKVAIAKYIAKMQVWYYEMWVERYYSVAPRRSDKDLGHCPHKIFKPSDTPAVNTMWSKRLYNNLQWHF